MKFLLSRLIPNLTQWPLSKGGNLNNDLPAFNFFSVFEETFATQLLYLVLTGNRRRFQSKTCFDHHAKKESRVIWYDSGNNAACLIGQNTLDNFRHDFTSCQRTWKSPPTRKVTRGGKVDCMFIYKWTHGEKSWKDWKYSFADQPKQVLVLLPVFQTLCCQQLSLSVDNDTFFSLFNSLLRKIPVFKTKLNARLALQQRADIFEANKISLPQNQSYPRRPRGS